MASDLCLSIADVTVGLFSDDPTLTLRVAQATERFLVTQSSPDVTIRAAWADPDEEDGGEKIFDSGGVWQLYAERGAYAFRFVSPVFGTFPYKVARFRQDFTSGEIRLDRRCFTPGEAVHALEYPLDELLVTHVLAGGRGVEVHACGVVDTDGRGHLFLGQSGAGKTTMARLWDGQEDVTVLSDDRIILRRRGTDLWMYGTPWHGEAGLASPTGARLTRIYFLRRGERNALVPLSAAETVARLFACSFPPFYTAGALDFTLGFLGEVATAVPSHELRFRPDERVVRLIQGREE